MGARRFGGVGGIEVRAPARQLAAVMTVVTAGVLPAFLTGALSVQVRQSLHFGEAGLGLAVGVFFLAAAATSAVLGRAAEAMGPSTSLRLSSLASAASMVAVAGLARTFGALLACLALGGMANALAQPAANVFIARTIDRSRLGLAFALKQSGVPAATLLGGAAVPALALTVGWRWAFVAGAALALIGTGAVPDVARPAPAVDGAATQRIRPPLAPLAVLGAAIGFGAAAAGTLGAFLVNAAVEAGMGEGRAGLLVAGGSAIGIAVRLAAGSRADRREGGALKVVALMLVLGAVGFAGFATASVPVIVLATPLAFGAGWGWPGLFNLAVVRANPDAPGIASGVTQTGTYLGAVAGPLLFGTIAERFSYRLAWTLAVVCCLVAAAGMLAGRTMIRRARLAASPPPI